jgi:hypothetical protein
MTTATIKKSIFLLAVTTIFIAQPVFSQITTFGVVDCGKWITNKSEPRKAWVLGYLTGMNTIHNVTSDTNPLGKVSSAEQIFIWIDNYCQKNPLKSIDDAGSSLFLELMKK